MIRTALLAIATLAIPAAGLAANYVLDKGHTEIRYTWDHAGVSIQSGEWKEIDGTVQFDPENIPATTIKVTIKAESLFTGVEPLDEHMRGPDMFNVAEFPTITFTSTSVELVDEENKIARVTGDLTMKGITKPITLDVTLVHIGAHPVGQFIDYYSGEWLGIAATGTLIRSEWDLGYAAPLTSDEITLEINAELKQQ